VWREWGEGCGNDRMYARFRIVNGSVEISDWLSFSPLKIALQLFGRTGQKRSLDNLQVGRCRY
jgi:hypothetical protein